MLKGRDEATRLSALMALSQTGPEREHRSRAARELALQRDWTVVANEMDILYRSFAA